MSDAKLTETVAKIAWGAFMEDAATEIEWYEADDEVKSIWRDAATRIIKTVRGAPETPGTDQP